MMKIKSLAIGALIITAAITLGAIYLGSESKENTMEQTCTQKTNVPPIDTSTPAHVETATFAMG